MTNRVSKNGKNTNIRSLAPRKLKKYINKTLLLATLLVALLTIVKNVFQK